MRRMAFMSSGTTEAITLGITHEEYIHAVRDIAVARLNDEESRRRLLAAQLTYGSGQPGLRGTCYYEAWKSENHHEFIEVCACGEQSDVQLVGTTIHELAHSLARFGSGHGPVWKLSAKKLGLIPG
jgi:hypothetical protein